MPRLTIDQVKALAPDPASLKAGQGLADTRHWASLGGNDAALWGECKGSGKEPYKVRLDLSDNGSACSCPSRKFPCKHALGLLLLAAASPGKLKDAAPPDWVSDWLEKRATRKEASAKKAEPKADAESRQKDATRRAAKREKLADTGLEALDRWLQDLVRQGLAAIPALPESHWKEQSARLVDAQLPGAARLVRELGEMPTAGDGWAERFLLQLARLNLLLHAYRKLDTLPAESQADVRTLLGWTVNQDDLLASTPGLTDDWLVVGQTLEEDESTGIRTQTSWLWGKTSRRPALIFQFAHRTQALDTSLAVGLTLRGEIVYFPGAYPLRAVFRSKQIVESTFLVSGFSNFSAFLDEYATALGKNPWIEAFPMVLENVIPRKTEQNSLLQDSQNQWLPLSPKFASPWELFALSGGHPLKIFGLWDGFVLVPMMAWAAERVVSL
jgi:hypothetical protein